MKHARIQTRRGPGFTLIELLVVVTLLAVAAGMVVNRLDTVTDWGRLRAAGSQIEALVHLASVQARTSAGPRLLQYTSGTDRVTMCRPVMLEGKWRWGDRATWNVGVRMERVWIEGRPAHVESVRFNGNGAFAAHVVVLSLHDTDAVVLLQPWAVARVWYTSGVDATVGFDALRSQVEANHATP